MTMTDETKVAASTAVDVEAVYGRALLDEVAAVTEQLAMMRDDLRAFMVRATGAVSACGAAEDRVLKETPAEIADQLAEVLTNLAGVEALSDLALEVGIQWSIFDPDVPGDNPVPGQFVPGMFGQWAPPHGWRSGSDSSASASMSWPPPWSPKTRRRPAWSRTSSARCRSTGRCPTTAGRRPRHCGQPGGGLGEPPAR